MYASRTLSCLRRNLLVIKILSVKASFAAAIRILISCNDLVSLLTVLPKKLNLLSFCSLMLHVGLSFWT